MSILYKKEKKQKAATGLEVNRETIPTKVVDTPAEELKVEAETPAAEDYTNHGTFGNSFKAARNDGQALFKWRGNIYNTKLKTDPAAPKPVKTPEPSNFIPSTIEVDLNPAAEITIDPEDEKKTVKTGLLKEVWGDLGKSPEQLEKYVNLLGVLGGAESSRGSRTSNRTSSAKGDFQITDDTFVVMKRRFYRYLKSNKDIMNMEDLKEKRPDMYKIMQAKSPLDLTRKEQAALLTVHMIQSDIPLNAFLKSESGSDAEKDASRDVYKYWVRDFDGMVYPGNAHVKNWNRNLKYLKTSPDNYKYLGVKRQHGGLAPSPLSQPSTQTDANKSPFVEPFKLPEGLSNIQRPHKKLTKKGITYDGASELQNTSIDPSLDKKKIEVPSNQFNINGVVADLVNKYSVKETLSPFVDNTSKPILEP